MPDYTFTLPPAASGLPYVVTDRAGLTVDSGTLETDADAVTLEVADLPYGVYGVKAGAASSPYTSTPAYFATGVIPATQPGASETAYLIGTGSGTSDGAYDTITLTAATALPSWVTIVDGNAVLGEEAGGCFVSATARANYDFSGTTPIDTPDQIGCYFHILRDTVEIIPDPDPSNYVVGDGEDEQSVTVSPRGNFALGGTISVEVGADGAAVSDAVTTYDVAVNITRLAPAPELA